MSIIEDEALATVVKMSRWAGTAERDLVILAEGNSSVKVGDELVVKASGAAMENAQAPDFVRVRRAPLLDLIEGGIASDEDVARSLMDATTSGTRRPSVETLLHVVCQEYDEVSAVLHTHPVPVNALLCSVHADQLVRGSYFPDQIVSLGRDPLLIPYVDPGLELAHHVHRVLRDHTHTTGAVPKVIYLQNHGMFALGADASEAQRITQMAVKSARIILGALSAGGAIALTDEHASRIHTRPDELFRREQLHRSPPDTSYTDHIPAL